MLETLRHEAFYACGTYIDEQEGIYAGWCARRDSFADGMPLVNERKDVALLFAGEVFAEPDSAAQLRQRGHELGARPASYLVHKYEDEGARFFAGLNGRFHGLLVDRANGAVPLQRPLRPATALLPPVQDRVLLRGGGEVHPGGSTGAAPRERAVARRARGGGMRARQPDAVRRHLRHAGCGAVVVPIRAVDASGVLLLAVRVGGPAGSGRRVVLPVAATDLRAEPGEVLRGAAAGRHLADRRPRHAHDPGLAQAGAEVAAVLHLRRPLPRFPRRRRRARGRPGVRSGPFGHRRRPRRFSRTSRVAPSGPSISPTAAPI